jgi:hypothetical protein
MSRVTVSCRCVVQVKVAIPESGDGNESIGDLVSIGFYSIGFFLQL